MDTGGGDGYHFVTKVERELIEMVEKGEEQKTVLERLQGLCTAGEVWFLFTSGSDHTMFGSGYLL